MKKNIWYALLAGASLRGMDQPPTRVTIGKDQLMALIKQSDAKRVLFANSNSSRWLIHAP